MTETPAPEITFRSDVSVELVKASASDADVVFAARVSTKGEQSLEDVDGDTSRSSGLINYLMRDRHGSPFEHNVVHLLRPRPDLRVARAHAAPHHVVQRGVRSLPRARAGVLRARPASATSCSRASPAPTSSCPASPEQHALVDAEVRASCAQSYAAYQAMLDAGVAREVARIVLPVTIYSSAYVTMNARALMNFLSLRTKREGSHFPSFPQREIEMVAEKYEAEFERLMPLTYAAFQANGRVAP